MVDPQAHILAGRPVADDIKKILKKAAANLSVKPKLAIIHSSPDPAADTYVRLKQQFGRAIGAAVEVLHPKPSAFEATIARLNTDPSVHGIIIQLPLPDGLPTETLLASVEAAKDVDGLAPASRFVTAGARGIIELLVAYQVPLTGAKVALVGTGKLFGEPLQVPLQQAGAQLEVFNLAHPIQAAALRRADVIIGATGRAGIITGDMVRPGAVVVDATGVDVAPAIHQRRDIRITPASGGVGPMTVAALFENLYQAAATT